MFRKFLIAAAVLTGLTSMANAQPFPRVPFPPRQPIPAPSPIDGPWFFRGDQFQPCYVETVATPFGTELIFTNEKGTPARARLSRDGKRVTIPEWNLIGRVKGDAIVWPNGDFWGR